MPSRLTSLRDGREPYADAKVLISDLDACGGKAWSPEPSRIIREAVGFKRQPERRSIQPSISVQILEDGDCVGAWRNLREGEAQDI